MLKKIALLLVVFLAQAVSAFAMSKDEFPAIVIHHEGENPKTLSEINSLLQKQQEISQEWFGLRIPKRSLYVYINQKDMQRRMHPLVTLFVRPDWYIGDNIGDRALIVSPNTPVKGHSYKSIIGAIPHEYMHTVVYSIKTKYLRKKNSRAAIPSTSRSTTATDTPTSSSSSWKKHTVGKW